MTNNEVELDGIVTRSAVISQYAIAPFSRVLEEAIPSLNFNHQKSSGETGVKF
ncbi:hypothetical protein IQ270_27555 [Microcoleus sp. LEGE 07076]|uniref:hypothetical protein n=1 Tax=Microcoleus sp. LEGE 07076 TaxID=915322 RepID=UPI00188288F6|nr:hypothetical protein [Microcoleus sp. LEGE 07076]MBE9188288.1 hypothetical protein [Microcoleus sp. LEGE 07076]